MAVYELMPMESRKVESRPARRPRRVNRPVGVSARRSADSTLSLLPDSPTRRPHAMTDSTTVSVRYGAPEGRALGAPTARMGELRALREQPLDLAPVVPLRATPLLLVDSRTASLLPSASTARITPPLRPARPRLTPRGRRLARTVAIFVALVAALTIAVLVRGGSDSLSPVGLRTSTNHVVVKPGQTLWSIASAALPQLDPRDAVQQVSELNGLQAGQTVVPGQDLRLPASS